MKVKLAIYARRSEDKSEGESIDNQVKICKRYIDAHYPQNDVDVYIDDDLSGRNTNRPQFQSMLKLVRKKYYSAVVFWKLDRVGRNCFDLLAFQKELEKLNVNMISVSEGFDPSTPAGGFMMTMLSGLAEMERKNISTRVIANMNEMAKEGKWSGGIPPFGFRSTTIEGKKYLENIPECEQIILDIFNFYNSCNSLFKTSTWLKDAYGLNKNSSSIRRILRNLVYCKADEKIAAYLGSKGVKTIHGTLNGENGLLSYGKSDKTKDEGIEYRTMDNWIVAVSKHKGIIDSKLFIEVNKVIDENAKERVGRRGTSDISFVNGISRCKYCGGVMRTKQRENRRWTYLVCGNKDARHKPDCPNKGIRIPDVEETVLHRLAHLSVEDLVSETNVHHDVTTLNQELEKKKKQIKNLITKMSLADDLEELFLEQIRELKQEVKELESSIDIKEKENILNEIDTYNKNALFEYLQDFNSTFHTLTSMDVKRTMLKKIVRTIYIDGVNKSIDIEMNF